jgi:hypothetical protein
MRERLTQGPNVRARLGENAEGYPHRFLGRWSPWPSITDPFAHLLHHNRGQSIAVRER